MEFATELSPPAADEGRGRRRRRPLDLPGSPRSTIFLVL